MQRTVEQVNHEGGSRLDEYLTAKALSERLKGMRPSTIYRMAAKGLIPSVSVGERLGGRRFVERDVRAALAQMVQPPRAYRGRKRGKVGAEA